MTRITTAALDTRITALDAKLDLLLAAIAGSPQEAEPTQVASEAKSPWTLMGEANEAHGRMYTARYVCITPGCKNSTGFYKVTSAETHAARKSHTYQAIDFS